MLSRAAAASWLLCYRPPSPPPLAAALLQLVEGSRRRPRRRAPRAPGRTREVSRPASPRRLGPSATRRPARQRGREEESCAQTGRSSSLFRAQSRHGAAGGGAGLAHHTEEARAQGLDRKGLKGLVARRLRGRRAPQSRPETGPNPIIRRRRARVAPAVGRGGRGRGRRRGRMRRHGWWPYLPRRGGRGVAGGAHLQLIAGSEGGGASALRRPAARGASAVRDSL